MENTYLIEEIMQNILKSQLFLLPVVIFALVFAKKKLSLTVQWKLHRGIIAAILLSPLLFLLPIEWEVHQFSKNVVNLNIQRPEFLRNLDVMRVDFNTQPEGSKKNKVFQPEAEMAGDPLPEIFKQPSPENLEKQQSFTQTPFKLPVFSIFGFISLIITLASIAGGIRFLFQWLRQSLFLSKAVLFAQKRAVIAKIEIIYSDEIIAPFSAGLIKKRIYLPTGYLNNTKYLRAVMKHEIIHIKEGHIYWTFIEKLLTNLFWYNPYIHLLHNYGEDLREFLCDKAVSDKITPIEYGKALLASAEEKQSSGRVYHLSTGWRKKNIMKQRLNKLFDTKKEKNGMTGIYAVLVGMMTFLMLLGIASCVTAGSEKASVEAAESKERVELKISLSITDYSQTLINAANAYMTTNPNVLVQFKSDIEHPEEEKNNIEAGLYNIEQIAEKLKKEDAPDLVTMHNRAYKDLVDEGYLANLNDFIEKDTAFNREDYYENILSGLEYKNGLYAFPQSFYMYTPYYVIPNKIIGDVKLPDDGMADMGEFISIMTALADNLVQNSDNTAQALLPETSKSFARSALRNTISNYIDNTTREVSFESEEFISLLKKLKPFLRESRGVFLAEPFDGFMNDAFKNNISAILPEMNITNFMSITAMANQYMTENVNVIALKNDNVYYASFFLFGINEKSPNKEIAWDFLKFLTTYEGYYNFQYGFSVNKKINARHKADSISNYILQTDNGVLTVAGGDIRIPNQMAQGITHTALEKENLHFFDFYYTDDLNQLLDAANPIFLEYLFEDTMTAEETAAAIEAEIKSTLGW